MVANTSIFLLLLLLLLIIIVIFLFDFIINIYCWETAVWGYLFEVIVCVLYTAMCRPDSSLVSKCHSVSLGTSQNGHYSVCHVRSCQLTLREHKRKE